MSAAGASAQLGRKLTCIGGLIEGCSRPGWLISMKPVAGLAPMVAAGWMAIRGIPQPNHDGVY